NTGGAILTLDKGAIGAMAARFYKGDGTMISLEKLSETPREYQGPHPVWQAQYNDRAKTRLYINAQTGQLATVRTRLWRVFDFMWRLHIMDITGEDSFNTWWLRLTSFLALLFALTGIGLLWHRIVLRPRVHGKLGRRPV
ncbi:MAG: PepSY domain-containing protein, partial [Litorimonas sp.]